MVLSLKAPGFSRGVVYLGVPRAGNRPTLSLGMLRVEARSKYPDVPSAAEVVHHKGLLQNVKKAGVWAREDYFRRGLGRGGATGRQGGVMPEALVGGPGQVGVRDDTGRGDSRGIRPLISAYLVTDRHLVGIWKGNLHTAI